MKKVLIAGFGSVAHELTRILPKEFYHITGLRRSKMISNLSKLTFLKADLSYINSLFPIKEEFFDYLIYCPSPDIIDEKNYYETYIKGLENLLQLKKLCKNLKQFIFISSTSVYGQRNGEWVDEVSSTLPQSFTGQILLKAENLVLSKMKNRSIILRFGGIYGKRKSRYIQQIKDGSVQIYNNFPRYINRIHFKDCAAIIKHFMEIISIQGIYLGVDDNPADQKEVIYWLAKKINLSISKNCLITNHNNLFNKSNKRCQNYKLKKSKYNFIYPSYKEGYSSMF